MEDFILSRRRFFIYFFVASVTLIPVAFLGRGLIALLIVGDVISGVGTFGEAAFGFFYYLSCASVYLTVISLVPVLYILWVRVRQKTRREKE